MVWRLADAEQFSVSPLVAHHDHWISILAVLIAILAAWVFLPVRDRFYANETKFRYFWLLIGSIAMGIGIWAMHFTAMLAYRLPMNVSYDISLTLISVIPAVVAVALTILLYNRSTPSHSRFNLMAMSLALGIGGMHFIGMEAVQTQATLYYKPLFFSLSLIAAYFFALLGLYTRIYFSEKRLKPGLGTLFGSIILGMAVSSMHYTAMHASYFIPHSENLLQTHSSVPYELIGGIIVAAAFLLFLIIIGSLVDYRIESISRSLKNSLSRFEQLVESSEDAIMMMSLEAKVTSWNKSAETIFGYSAPEMLGRMFSTLLPKDKLGEDTEIFDKIRNGDKVEHLHTNWLKKDGSRLDISASISPIIDDKQDIIGFSCIARDISEQIQANKTIEFRANFDELTELPNRSQFHQQILQHITDCKRHNKRFALFYLDLDNFKDVNDSLGHDAGDKLLQKISQHLHSNLRQSDFVARFGGDEFVGLISDIHQQEDLDKITAKLIQTTKTSFNIDAQRIQTSVSMGVALYPEHGTTSTELLKNADRALYDAKAKGKNQYVIYNDSLGEHITKKLMISESLAQAPTEQLFELHYQPIINLSSGCIEKAEALIRYHHHELGQLSPEDFIPIAEENGHIAAIGQWVLEEVLTTLPRCIKNQGDDFQISINKSPVQLNLDNLECHASLNKNGHRYSANLIIEITETTLLQNNELTRQRLQNFRKSGIEIAIDDFGTGYSSLSYLNKFEVDYIKLDKTFIQQLEHGNVNLNLCDSIIYMAHKLGMKVVAEGVETESQHELISSIGCDFAQGYFYSKPLPADEFDRYLEANREEQRSRKKS